MAVGIHGQRRAVISSRTDSDVTNQECAMHMYKLSSSFSQNPDEGQRSFTNADFFHGFADVAFNVAAPLENAFASLTDGFLSGAISSTTTHRVTAIVSVRCRITRSTTCPFNPEVGVAGTETWGVFEINEILFSRSLLTVNGY